MRSIVIAKLLLLLALIVGLCTYSEGNNEEDKEKDVLRSNHEVFKPTHEWQEVKPGQAIPRGLHVRMNMYSGKTEAKLLDPETSSETKPTGSTRTDVIAVSEVVEDTSEQPYMSPDELRKVLGQTGENSDLEVNMEEEVEKVKNKYRSYDELVKEFGNLNLAVKTDMELLLELTASAKQQLSGKIVEEDFVRTLTDIEYLVHQIDNGQEFIRLGGFTDVLLPALNVTSPKVRSEALWLLGSAAQSNPKVQIAALDAGCIPLLLRAAVLDPDEVVRTRAVYALSCLLRRFPTAQAKLMEEGGLAALGSIFDNDRTDELKTKLKIITLINDLVLEQHEVESTVKDLPQDLPDETNDTSTVEDAVKKLRRHQRGELLEKRRQYRSIALEEHLIVEGWCSRFSNLLVQLHKHSLGGGRVQRRDDLGSVLSKDIPFRPEHDVIEKVVECMLVLSDSCTPQFRADLELKEVLRELTHWYKDLGVREEMVQKENFLASTNNNPSSGNNYDQVNKELDFYYSSIAEKLHSLSQLLYESRTGPLHSKDEL